MLISNTDGLTTVPVKDGTIGLLPLKGGKVELTVWDTFREDENDQDTQSSVVLTKDQIKQLIAQLVACL